MESWNFDTFVDKFSKGTVSDLNSYQLDLLKRLLYGFREIMINNCMSHNLYRCSLTGDEEYNVYLNIIGSDISGAVKKVQVTCNIKDMELYTRSIQLDNKKEICKHIYKMVSAMSKLPVTIGLIDFPFEGDFKEGIITDYKLEKKSKFICIRDSLDFSYLND